MGRRRIAGSSRAALVACVLVFKLAQASGLQVAPISLEIGARQNADGLWLSNTGDAPLQAQVRVFHWTQDAGGEKLETSRSLVVSPPMLELAPGARQLVRVIRAVAPPATREDAYRVVIDELPIAPLAADATDSAAADKRGLRFVLRYSVPVFLTPTQNAAPAPRLQGSVVREGESIVLQVGNDGDKHAQLGNLVYVDAASTRTELVPGLLGYVLAGATMRWPLDAAQARFAGGRLQSRINGEPAERTVATVVDAP